MIEAQLATPPYVRQGERVVWLGKPTLLVLLSNAAGLVVFILFASLFSFTNQGEDAPPIAAFVPLLVFGAALLLLGLNGLRLRRTEYVITDQSVYVRSGIIGQTVIQTTYDKITDIALRQDVLGRVFGYSTLQVNTAGSNTAPVQMSGLPRAVEVKQRIEQGRETYLGRSRPAKAPAWTELPAKLPLFTLDEDIIIVTCPTSRKPFKRPRSDLGKQVVCPTCGKRHLIKEAPRARKP